MTFQDAPTDESGASRCTALALIERQRPYTRLDAYEDIIATLHDQRLTRSDRKAILAALAMHEMWVFGKPEPAKKKPGGDPP